MLQTYKVRMLHVVGLFGLLLRVVAPVVSRVVGVALERL